MQSIRSNKYWLANMPLQHKMMLVIGLLIGPFLLTSMLTLNALRQQGESRHWADHTHHVLTQLQGIRNALVSSQVGAQGYLLTQQGERRVQFERSMQAMEDNLHQLRSLTVDNPLQQARIDQIDSLSSNWRQQLISYLIGPLDELRATNPISTAAQRERIQINYLAHRKVQDEDILLIVDRMVLEENQLLDKRDRQLAHDLHVTKVINSLAIVLALLLAWVIIRWTSLLVTWPIRRLTDHMTRLSNHDHDFEIRQLRRKDEIGEISRAMQVFRQMAIETQEQSWLKTQVSGVAHRLQQSTTHREFGEWLTGELVPLLKAGVGLFYSHDESRFRLDLLGSYGLRLDAAGSGNYMPGEGLVGQCATERKPIILSDVPANYVQIESGSGAASPTHVIIMPLLFRDSLIGVLELASFTALTPLQRQLLDELLPIVALTLENLNRAISTSDLLEHTREQAEELRLSELVMRQQKDVLRDNNDALQAKTAELEEQSERLIASEEELRVQAEELQASNEELREKTESLNQQKHVLKALQQETADKANELERASRYKSEFLANMSHELRTPLNSLLILSRSLADNDTGNLDGEQVESARIIHDAGTSLLNLINDILDLSKIEAGRMELVIDQLPLSDLQRRIRRSFTHVAQKKNLSFTVESTGDLPDVLRTDSSKLEQITNNLLSNAFKFTAAGGVNVKIGRPPTDALVPPALQGKLLITITVSDTGIGIAPDKFQRIFNAFEQVDASTSRNFGGTGLGLAISRRMAMLLGGDISLSSESGKGSRFVLWLPETPPEHEATAIPLLATEANVPALSAHLLLPDTIEDDRHALESGQITILVIEDDAAFARILMDMIHRKGYRVLAATDGEAGLELARQYHPTGILLDVMLPAMDGWTVMDKLKADASTRTIPVHFISATDEASRGLGLGAVGFLTKPVSRESIGAAFEKLLHFAKDRDRRLLVVDDEADSRTAVRTMLRADGVRIDEAGTAEEALELSRQNRYDCIVLDLGLPGMSGMELLEQLSREPGGASPVVVYSARDLSREENLLLRQYTDSIVIKGARSPERLLDEVSLFLHSIKHAPADGRGDTEKLDLAGRKVLLVDDDMRNLFALSKVLRGWGLAVNLVQDGHKALRALAEDPPPEIILMDIMMPGMDGYETIRQIRSQPALKQLPIIALTAKAMRCDREKCLEVGASDYLSKPIDIGKLSSMLRVWLHG